MYSVRGSYTQRSLGNFSDFAQLYQGVPLAEQASGEVVPPDSYLANPLSFFDFPTLQAMAQATTAPAASAAPATRAAAAPKPASVLGPYAVPVAVAAGVLVLLAVVQGRRR